MENPKITENLYAEQSLAEKNETFAAQESKPKRTVGEIFSAINIFEDRNLIQWSFATLVLALVLAGGWWIVNKQSNQTEIAGQSPTADSEQTLPTIENNNAKTANAANENARNEPNLENKTSPPTENEAIPKQTPVVEPKQTPKSIKPPAAPQVKIASFILAPSLRSGSRISSLSLSEDITDVAMSLQLEGADYAAYRVRLMTESNASLWQSVNLKLSNKGENQALNVRFPAKLLKSKIYFLQVSGISADGAVEIISDYPFRIVRQ